ncbi:hypothetical protein [Brevundimonas sp.]|uniref:hypothetical protein n=1 Tax=Brevundimonas sp. TaxID=1871086 RepID=UPI00262DD81A|nr:hypothetical protein [Brevundimonas sp.]
MDIGYVLSGEDEGERLGYAICKTSQWRSRLSKAIPVPVDLQFAEPDHDQRVWPAIREHGVLIYQQA